MLCLLSTTFSPSVNMEGFVHGFIQSDASSTVEDEEVASKIRIMAACTSTPNLIFHFRADSLTQEPWICQTAFSS